MIACRVSRGFLSVTIAVAGAACGSVNSNTTDAAPAIDSASAIDAHNPADAAPPACDLSKPFGTPVQVPGVNSPQADVYIDLSPDELTAYISSDRTGTLGGYDLWVATRTTPAGTFGTLTPLTSLNSAHDEQRPAITADGLTMYFDDDADGSNYDIWVATRAAVAADFGAPSDVSVINDPTTFDTTESINADGTVMYFASYRGTGYYQIYRTTRPNTSSPFSTPVAVGELNTPEENADPTISADGLTIYFSSVRAGGMGGLDIWMASRTSTSDGFGTPVNVTELNTSTHDWPSWLSLDKCRLYFASDRTGGDGSHDLWVAARPL
jgi:Tol biopolymer transport system component